MDHIRRRRYLQATTAVACGIGLAGCTGDGEDVLDDGGEKRTLIEYEISDPKSHEDVPEGVVEHPNPEAFVWVVVEFELLEGDLDTGDLLGLILKDIST